MHVHKFARKYHITLTDLITEETTHVIMKTGIPRTFIECVASVAENYMKKWEYLLSIAWVKVFQ